jgi:hypothetical protein
MWKEDVEASSEVSIPESDCMGAGRMEKAGIYPPHLDFFEK